MKNKTIKAVLRTARKYIVKGWCRGAAARNNKGNEVHWDNPSACAWCLTGALTKAEVGHGRRFQPALDALLEQLPEEELSLRPSRYDLESFNDRSPNKKRVLALIDRAIKSCG